MLVLSQFYTRVRNSRAQICYIIKKEEKLQEHVGKIVEKTSAKN